MNNGEVHGRDDEVLDESGPERIAQLGIPVQQSLLFTFPSQAQNCFFRQCIFLMRLRASVNNFLSGLELFFTRLRYRNRWSLMTRLHEDDVTDNGGTD